jgi:RNA polymerase sigma-70 factor (ECF subfamily)
MSQTSRVDRYSSVNATSRVVPGGAVTDEGMTDEAVAGDSASESAPFDLDSVFRAQFARMARVIARVVRDQGRAEELAVEAFLKLWRSPQVHNADSNVEAWLYRTAVRLGLDELRRQTRRSRFENCLRFASPAPAPSPEELHAAVEEQSRVRVVLAALPRRQSELLLLRSHDLSYNEVAAALEIHPASLGKLLARAQQSFRKEYIKRYGQQ